MRVTVLSSVGACLVPILGMYFGFFSVVTWRRYGARASSRLTTVKFFLTDSVNVLRVSVMSSRSASDGCHFIISWSSLTRSSAVLCGIPYSFARYGYLATITAMLCCCSVLLGIVCSINLLSIDTTLFELKRRLGNPQSPLVKHGIRS